jgi:hypothetical protein
MLSFLTEFHSLNLIMCPFRIETKLQVKDNNEAILQGSGTKLFEEFQERLNQIRVDSEVQNRLNDRIAELREANATLTAGMSSRELEIQTMTKQVDGLRLDLTDCRGQLTAKSDELAATFALPREDPQLRRKLQDLESVNEALCSQADAAKEETSLANEELRNLRDAALETQDQLEEIEGKLSVAQDSVKKLTEDKKKYIVTSKMEADKARQEVAKAASASKAEMTIRHDALVRSLEQRRAEVETQLRLVKEELQRSQNDRTAFSSNFDKLQTELNYYKERFLLQETHINRLEEQNLHLDETERRAISIQETRHETVKLRTLHEQMRSEVVQRTDAALRAHKEVEDKLRKVDDLEKENELLKRQKMDLQMKLDRLSPSINHPNTKSRVIEGHTSHQFEQVSSRKSQAIASHECQTRPSNVSPSQFSYNPDDILRSGHRTTPMKPLQNTSNQRYLASRDVVNLPGRHSPLGNSTSCADLGIIGPPPQVTRPPFQKASLLSASDSPLELQMISTQQSMSDSRPLRPARRKSSNTAQPQQLQTREQVLSCTETTKYSFQTSTTYKDEQTPHLVNEKSANRQSPAEIQPFSAITPIGTASSSPLPDIVSMMEHLGSPSNHVDHQGTYKKNLMSRDPGPGELPSNSRSNATRQGGGPARFAKNTTAAQLTRNGTPLSYQFSDVDQFPAATVNVHKTGPSAAEESSRRRELQPLKGVLKKPGAVPKMINKRGNSGKRPSATFEPSDTAPMQDRSSARGANRNQSRTQAKNTRGGSSYNRVASGKSTKSNAMDVASDHFSRTPHQTPIGQQRNNTEKSPPMAAPRRNSLKRAASSVLLAEQPAKAPRLSLERRYSGRVIPNSQEAEYY